MERASAEQWNRVTARHHTATLGRPVAPDINRRTEEARGRLAGSLAGTGTGVAVVDLYVDPVCPYTWVVHRWLTEVERARSLDLRHHVMSLAMLNETGPLGVTERELIETRRGPSRVATAVLLRRGRPALRAWHTAFGERIFDYWRYASPEELAAASRAALAATGLPLSLADAADDPSYDGPLRASHEEAVAAVGPGCGTPVVVLDGRAFFGPVLSAIPRGDAAVRLFDSLAALSSEPAFNEIKRVRTAPPVFD
jgi:hypothetical protein